MLNFPPAFIPATQTRVVHSALANDDYLISVALPFHYEERSDEVWPVIYVLDGNMHFNMVVDMVRSAVYPANPADRTLMGHSNGANFALYTLFHQPQLFQRCVAASFDALLNDEEKFAEKNDTLPVRLHMIWEGLTEEAFAGPRSLVDRLASRHYAGFHMTHQAVHSTHCAMVPLAYQSGLVQVFS